MSDMEGLELGRLLGSGGFADVYEAFEPQLARRVAVKVFRTRVDGSDRKSFEREAQVTGRLSGVRNIVHVYRCGFTVEDNPYLVMERMEYPVAALIGNEHLSVDHVLHTGVAIGEALQVAHDEGILHRDIKPGNILVDRYGEPALSDFGISSVMNADASSSIYGFTAEHAAPELFEESSATPATDVYSLAATLFTMIEGRPPFVREPGEGPLAFMTRVVSTPPPPCTYLMDSIPELDAILRSALGKDPLERPELGSLISSLRSMVITRAGANATSDSAEPTVGPLPKPDDEFVDPVSDSGSDTVVGRGTSSSPTAVDDGPAPADDLPERDPGPPEPTRLLRRHKALVGATLLVGVAATITAVLLGTTGQSPEDVDGPEGDTTTSSDPKPEDPSVTTTNPDKPLTSDEYPSGVTNSQSLNEPGIRDTSALLRARIDQFAATTEAPSVRDSVMTLQQDASDLDFGDTPVRADYGAMNSLYTQDCYRLVLNDVVILGATASIWSNAEEFTFVNAAQFQTEAEAQQYFWAASLFVGIDKDSCSGWPEDGVAIDPTDITVNREDFEMDIEADDRITAIDDGLRIEDFTAKMAYEAVARVGTVVIVTASGNLFESADATPYVRTLEEAVAVFSAV